MYKRILVVVAAEPATRAAASEGVALAAAHGADVVFLAVLPRFVMPTADVPAVGVPSPQDFEHAATTAARRALAAATVLANKAGLRSRTHVASGPDDAECILDAALRRRCGLIVVASSGLNAVMRIFSGSVIPALITHATMPVLVVPGREPKPGAIATAGARRRPVRSTR